MDKYNTTEYSNYVRDRLQVASNGMKKALARSLISMFMRDEKKTQTLEEFIEKIAGSFGIRTELQEVQSEINFYLKSNDNRKNDTRQKANTKNRKKSTRNQNKK